MNYRMVGFTLSRILAAEAVLLLLPLLVTVGYGEAGASAFLITIALLVACAAVLGFKVPERKNMYAREGFVIVALAWVLMAAFGALPFVISGEIPNYVDAFFETVSGFTTTGSTILTDIEAMSKGMLFWRSFTHWIGGMGVLVFVMAVIPLAEGRSIHLMRAEMAGPTVGKLSSKAQDTAKVLYGIYTVMTLVEAVLLRFGGMNWYDAFIHAFGSAGTGGFSNRAASVGAYNSAYIDIVIGVFILLFGVNFNLYYFALRGRIKDALKSEELRGYLIIVAFSTLTIAWNIRHLYQGAGNALRFSFFQVSSIITTTGYATADFNVWPLYSKIVLVLLMFVGGCAGSTGGGIKVGRVLILVKSAIAEIKRMLHPHAITTARFEGRPIEEKTLRGAQLYFILYALIMFVSTLLVAMDPAVPDTETCFTAVSACINNVGPGLSLVGPIGNFAFLSVPSKLILSFNMLIGRLEILPMVLIFAPTVWSKKRSFR
ncbi:MAG: TrkH family potassium uptake protein [Clostridia bacterium]|nr:TrkH family potassium uptake protein [Clostridia bacterium]